MFPFKKNIEIIIAFLLFLLVFILKYPVLNLPYSGDVLNYVIPAAQYIYQNTFTIFLWEYSNGHPPFYFILLGFIFKILGNSQIVAHLVGIFFSFLAVYYTYLLGKCIFNKKVGIIASLLMFFYPTFFSFSGMLYLAVPLSALTVMSLYFFVKKQYIPYAIFSSLLVLTKERAIVIPIALLIYKIFKDKKISVKKHIIFVIPIFVFSLLLLGNKLYYGYFLYPISASVININLIKIMLNALIVLKSIFFDYYKWILTSLIVVSCFSFKLLRNKRKIFYYFIPSIILFVLLFNSSKLSIYFNQFFPKIINYFLILKEFSLLFALLFFILLLSFKKFINFWNNEKLYPLYIVFIFAFISYFLIIPFAPRYALPIYPIIFILFSISLVKIFKKYSYVVFLILLIIFAVQWTGVKSDENHILENNMEYLDVLKTHRMATNYLEENFPDSVILASFPQFLELRYPYLGYVKKPFNNVISIPPLPGLITKNSTIFLNPDKYNKTVDLNTIEILYSSAQESATKYSKELNKIFNKTLIKRFELNGKIVEIYKINQEISYPNYFLPLD